MAIPATLDELYVDLGKAIFGDDPRRASTYYKEAAMRWCAGYQEELRAIALVASRAIHSTNPQTSIMSDLETNFVLYEFFRQSSAFADLFFEGIRQRIVADCHAFLNLLKALADDITL